LSIWMKQLGADVTGISIDIPSEPSHFNAAILQDKLDDYRVDIRDGDALKTLVKKVKPDFVFHLAAQPLVRRSYVEPMVTWHTNTIGTINVLEALRELDNECVAIMITSDKCYDNVEWVWGYRETDAMGGPDPYSASKGAAGLLEIKHAEAVAAYGGSPILLDLSQLAVDELAERLNRQYGVKAAGFSVDITNESQIESNTNILIDLYGKIDGLVNNAANNPKVEDSSENFFQGLKFFQSMYGTRILRWV